MKAIILGLFALALTGAGAHATALVRDAAPALTGLTLLIVLLSAALGLFAAGAATPARSTPDASFNRIRQR